MDRLDPVVAEVSPNLYAAAKNANLTGVEKTQVEQMGYALREHRRLSKLTPDVAKKQFAKLDPNAQEGLKFMFKSAPYLQPDPSIGDRVFGVAKSVGKGFASPLIQMYNMAAGWGRTINSPSKCW